MAIIDCPECGSQVSTKADFCPKCGNKELTSTILGEAHELQTHSDSDIQKNKDIPTAPANTKSVCGGCGKSFGGPRNFCPYCGKVTNHPRETHADNSLPKNPSQPAIGKPVDYIGFNRFLAYIAVMVCFVWWVYSALNPKSGTVRTRVSYSPPAIVSTTSRNALIPECGADTKITGYEYSVIGSGHELRTGPSDTARKLINQKATSILGHTEYASIDDTTRVHEECTKGDWSWVRVVKPEWLGDTYRGWIQSRVLDRGQSPKKDKYSDKISAQAIKPYTKQAWPKTHNKYPKRFDEINALRIVAARLAIDSGKCDFVDVAEISDMQSTPTSLSFFIDCRNGQRIRLDESEIRKSSQVLTQEEKSWTEKNALETCVTAITSQRLVHGSVVRDSISIKSLFKAPVTFNTAVEISFDSKDAEVTRSYTAVCHFSPGNLGEIEVFPQSASVSTAN